MAGPFARHFRLVLACSTVWIAVAAVTVGTAHAQRNVSFFNDPAFVDVANEAASMRADLVGLGHDVTDFTGTSEAAWAAALGAAEALVVPELEAGNLDAALPAGTKALIREFVEDGGNLVTTGTLSHFDVEFVNGVFGFTINNIGGGAQSGNSNMVSGAANGTTFAGGVDPLPNANGTFFVSSLPVGTRTLYVRDTTPVHCSVFTRRYGFGNISYLGHDWYSGTNAAWASILDAAVEMYMWHPRRAVRFFNDPAFVDVGNEAASMRAELVGLGHDVTDFTGTSDAAWRAAVRFADVLVIPELEVVADLPGSLSAATKSLLRDFVDAGGNVVTVGTISSRDVAFLNDVFGYSLADPPAGTSTGDSDFDPSAAVGTAFAGSADPLPHRSGVFFVTSPPSGARVLYTRSTAPTEVTAFTHRSGLGSVSYLGYDWFQGSDPDWAQVLDAAVDDRAPRRSILFFNDPAFVPVADEALAMRTELVVFGHHVSDLFGTSSVTWADALASSDVLVVPKLENGDLAAVLPAATVRAVQDFVATGGNVVTVGDFFEWNVGLLNTVFGYSVASPFGSSSLVSVLDPAAAAGTTFAAGVDPLAGRDAVYVVTSTPATARDVYTWSSDPSRTTVFTSPYGFGNVSYVGYDWFHGRDTAWASVLESAVMLPAVDGIPDSGCADEAAPFLSGAPSSSTGFTIDCPTLTQSCSTIPVIVFGACSPGPVVVPPPIGCGPCNLVVNPSYGSKVAPWNVNPGLAPGFSMCVQCGCLANVFSCIDLSKGVQIVIVP